LLCSAWAIQNVFREEKISRLLTFILFLFFLWNTRDNDIQENLRLFIPRDEKKMRRYSYWTRPEAPAVVTNLFVYHRGNFPFPKRSGSPCPVLVDSKICSPGTTDVAMSLHRVVTVSSDGNGLDLCWIE
jgi:hypothetical protein